MTSEQQQAIDEILRKESRQTKVDGWVKQAKIEKSEDTQKEASSKDNNR